MAKKPNRKIPRLEVYSSHSVLVQEEGRQTFKEGQLTTAAAKRLVKIRKALESGFLDKLVGDCRSPDIKIEGLDDEALRHLTQLVDSVTSEVGRAIVGLTVLQLAIKSIYPDQSIRLHKGGGTGESFSWQDGLPMRVLDKEYNTPILRKYDLVKLNADGVFMTRSLAENYPYSQLYKAASRGAKTEWLAIVDMAEFGKLDPTTALKQLVVMLFNRSDAFKKDAELAMRAAKSVAGKLKNLDEATKFIRNFVDSSTYAARLFEIAMHSLFQVLEDNGAFGDGFLKKLSQMRSANKKHGNIGDIEITTGKRDNLHIVESWDAKYGKAYLREELDELHEKLQEHPETKFAGFVVDANPNLKPEIKNRIEELEQTNNIRIEIVEFDDWISRQAKRISLPSERIANLWLIAFAESLCQFRRDRAPIDEPADSWVRELRTFAEKWR
ncbi:MAG TPA: hypothetical protein VE344_04690 [Methylomirabilota bacterium]|nr:hypothetical protein [Methylomirabilota bacterium]